MKRMERDETASEDMFAASSRERAGESLAEEQKTRDSYSDRAEECAEVDLSIARDQGQQERKERQLEGEL